LKKQGNILAPVWLKWVGALQLVEVMEGFGIVEEVFEICHGEDRVMPIFYANDGRQVAQKSIVARF
jgi:hypothetical protein